MACAIAQPKKPSGGGYGQFLAEKRPEFMAQCKGQPVSAVSKLAGAAWKALPEAKQAPYNAAFKKAQAKYAVDMEAFLAGGGVAQKGAMALRKEKKKAKEGKLKKVKDPNAPKKPAGGGYGCFVNANRAEFQKEAETKKLPKFSGVTTVAGQKWKAMGDAEKQKWTKEFEAKMAEYKKAMESYTPPAGAEDAAANSEEAKAKPAKRARLSKDGKGEEKKEAAAEKKEAAATKKEAKKANLAEKKEAAAAKKEAKKANVAPKKKANVAPKKQPQVDIPSSVLAKAEQADMASVLKRLLARDDIRNAGIAAGKALSVLQESNGLLHPARRALLGA